MIVLMLVVVVVIMVLRRRREIRGGVMRWRSSRAARARQHTSCRDTSRCGLYAGLYSPAVHDPPPPGPVVCPQASPPCPCAHMVARRALRTVAMLVAVLVAVVVVVVVLLLNLEEK